MIATGIAAVLLLLALIAIGIGVATRRASHKENARRGEYIDEEMAAFGTGGVIFGAVLALAGIIVALFNMVHVVGANEAGVPVTLGKPGEAIQSGLNITAPWTNVEKLPTRPETVTTDVQVQTKDGGKVGVRVSGRWGTDRENAKELFLQARTSDEGKIEKDIVIPQIEGAANEFYGTRTVTEAVNGSEWTENATGVSALVTTRLAKYGIDLVDVQIRKTTPDEATQNALNTLNAQVRKTQLAEEANRTAEKESATRITVAEGQRTAAEQFKGLSESEIAGLCMLATERMNEDNSSRNLATYVTACGTTGTGVLVQGK